MYIADTPNKAPFAGIFDQVAELKTRLSTAAKQSATIAYALTGPEPAELAPAQLASSDSLRDQIDMLLSLACGIEHSMSRIERTIGSPAVLQGVSGSASVIYSNATPLRY